MDEVPVPRGRRRVRSLAPHATRRLSRGNLTPPRLSRDSPSPPSSPVSVLPSSAASRKTSVSLLLGLSDEARLLCSPTSLLRPLRITPVRPPGFDTPTCLSPTASMPRFIPASLDARTPQAPPCRDCPAPAYGLDKLFAPAATPLLARPEVSPPPTRPTARRKTLAIHRTGFSARRNSSRLNGRRRKPVAKAAEDFVCRNPGIVQDGEDVTEQALEVLAHTFDNQATAEKIRNLRLMFRLDSEQDKDLEGAMMRRGGAEALEQFAPDGELNVDNV